MHCGGVIQISEEIIFQLIRFGHGGDLAFTDEKRRRNGKTKGVERNFEINPTRFSKEEKEWENCDARW